MECDARSENNSIMSMMMMLMVVMWLLLAQKLHQRHIVRIIIEA